MHEAPNRNSIHSIYKQCIETKKSVIYNSKHTLPQNKEIWLQTTLTPIIDHKEKITAIIAIDSDISQLKEANEKLRALDIFKEEMTTMIVHDLKNPLNSIIGLAENDIVKQSGKHMLNLVMNILDVQKHENAKINLKTATYFLDGVAKSAMEQVSLLYERIHE